MDFETRTDCLDPNRAVRSIYPPSSHASSQHCLPQYRYIIGLLSSDLATYANLKSLALEETVLKEDYDGSPSEIPTEPIILETLSHRRVCPKRNSYALGRAYEWKVYISLEEVKQILFSLD
ncbi:hypothetical protein CVT25_003191 [Psilocybe cyanescens]|uniref:Uncharacterized protein n=1 Tax=Psilocybe cyanescens TaxID=93625 RepID=A0A409XF30_PSICY|nr:hypothetical protein CVT25_003191 [Psilocybe cyanescens]